MLDPGIPRPRPRPRPLAFPRGHADLSNYTHCDFGLSIVTSRASDVQWTGYRLKVLADRYLIEVWDLLSYRDLIYSYAATLTGEPERMVMTAFGLRSWADALAGGHWGTADDRVSITSTGLALQDGRLLPPPPRLHTS